VWASGYNSKVLRTTNGGLNWEVLPLNGLPNNYDFINIFGISANTAIVTGYYASSHFFTYRTSNGGLSWNEVLHVQDRFIDAVWMKNENEGIMIGDPYQYNPTSFTVKYTNNGGINWNDSYAPPQAFNSDASYPNSLYLIDNYVWFGAYNSVKFSTNYGNNWTAQITDMETYAIFFKNSLTGMAGGLAGSSQGIKFTTNSGLNWTNPATPGTGYINGIACNGSTWWCSKSGLNIYKSTNDGASWNIDYTSPLYNFKHLSKSRNGSRIWAVGNRGLIVMSEGLIGLSPISNEVPNTFSLAQNYPNPFNPVTKIKFQIPLSRGVSEGRGVPVKLVVYDILGKEVAVLVNENLNPGTYEVEWNAGKYASGIYFYSLITEGFSETKKMILVK
jgi:hypothetical protein